MPGDVYDRYIGRYSRTLAPRFIAFAGVDRGPVLDVGCGPGGLTLALASALGAQGVAAVDPSASFVEACRARVPGADVHLAGAEALPFPPATFEAVLAQLVLPFLSDAASAMAEAKRVARPGGTVAACMFASDGLAVSATFWRAALRFDPAAPDDAHLPFRKEGELLDLFHSAGFRDVVSGRIDLEARYTDFVDFWEPFASGVGPTGDYLGRQSEERRAGIRDECREILGRPAGAFTLPARVLAVRGRT